MNVRFRLRLPWALAFSFARAIEQPALEIWHGEEAHVLAAQQALAHRASYNRAARRGEIHCIDGKDISMTPGLQPQKRYEIGMVGLGVMDAISC